MKQFKLFFIGLWILSFPFIGTISTSAEPEADTQEEMEDMMLEEISLGGIQTYWNELVSDYNGYLPELEKTSLSDFIKNSNHFSLKGTFKALIKYLFHELIMNGKLLGLLLML